jgi:hypothetical protein
VLPKSLVILKVNCIQIEIEIYIVCIHIRAGWFWTFRKKNIVLLHAHRPAMSQCRSMFKFGRCSGSRPKFINKTVHPNICIFASALVHKCNNYGFWFMQSFAHKKSKILCYLPCVSVNWHTQTKFIRVKAMHNLCFC